MSVILETCLKHLVLPAKMRMLEEWIEFGRSLIYIVKSKDPRILP